MTSETLAALLDDAWTLRSGETATLRLLRHDDRLRLGTYLTGLSKATTDRWGPHGMDQATADTICATLDHTRMLRAVATVPDAAQGERLVAYQLVVWGVWESDRDRYARLGIALSETSDCTLAPSVADAYQDQGVGSAVATRLRAAAARVGRRRMVLWGGVQADNRRAVHFYGKLGFVKVGEFLSDAGERGTINNWDMIAAL